MAMPWDAELGLYPPSSDDPLWWLSFTDPDQFLGVVIVQAPTLAAAITRSHKLGVNPGGQIAGTGAIPPGFIAETWRDRLLSRDEAGSIPDPF